jgi:hypothetical protein
MIKAGVNGAAPKIKQNLQITFTDIDNKEHVLDQLRENNIRGEDMWQVLDSFVNVAIDNVKDQILYFINANSSTGNAYSALIASGIPLKPAVHLMLQPSIRELTNRFDLRDVSAMRKAVKVIRGEVLGKAGLPADGRASKKLANIHARHLKNSLGSSYENMTKQEAIRQLDYLEAFRRSFEMGNGIFNMAKFLNIGRSIPVLVSNLEAWQGLLKKIAPSKVQSYVTKPDSELMSSSLADLRENHKNTVHILPTHEEGSLFPFEIPEFFKVNTHIARMTEVANDLHEVIRDHFPIHSVELHNFTSLPEGVKLQLDLEDEKSRVYQRRLLYNYLMARVVDQITTNSEGFSDVYSAKTSYNYINNRGKKISVPVEGARAWSINFVRKIRALKDFEDLRNPENKNPFISYLGIPTTDESAKIRFTSPSSLTDEEIINLQYNFKLLKHYNMTRVRGNKWNVEFTDTPTENVTPLMQEFLIYAALNYGMNYSTSNYGYVLPNDMIKDFTDGFTSQIDLLMNEPTVRDNLKQHFELNVLINQAKNINSFVNTSRLDIEPLKSGEKVKIDGREFELRNGKFRNQYYDLAYPKPSDASLITAANFPPYIVSDIKKGRKVIYTIYRRLNSLDTFGPILYQKIGKYSSGIYDVVDPDLMYSMDHYFNPTELYLYVKDVDAETIQSVQDLSPFIERGEVINLVNKEDISRKNMTPVIVEAKAGKNKYTVKKIHC